MASSIPELEAFVRDSLMRGASRPDIDGAMRDAGWSAEQASSALSAFADRAFVVPVPVPRPSLSAREAFLYLMSFTTLYLSVYHFGSLCFQFIERALPDAAVGRFGDGGADSMRWSVASLVIAFPLFLVVSRRIASEVAVNPVKRLSPIRRWLTYLTLFLAASVLIGDLTALVYSLLGGELTVRFVLKVCTIGVIAGVVFAHYLADLRHEERP